MRSPKSRDAGHHGRQPAHTEIVSLILDALRRKSSEHWRLSGDPGDNDLTDGPPAPTPCWRRSPIRKRRSVRRRPPLKTMLMSAAAPSSSASSAWRCSSRCSRHRARRAPRPRHEEHWRPFTAAGGPATGIETPTLPVGPRSPTDGAALVAGGSAPGAAAGPTARPPVPTPGAPASRRVPRPARRRPSPRNDRRRLRPSPRSDPRGRPWRRHRLFGVPLRAGARPRRRRPHQPPHQRRRRRRPITSVWPCTTTASATSRTRSRSTGCCSSRTT